LHITIAIVPHRAFYLPLNDRLHLASVQRYK